MKIDKIFVGNRIKKIRTDKNMTMEEFGKLLNAPKSAVNNWEKGRNLPNKSRLNKIAKLGDMTLDELCKGSFRLFVYNLITESEHFSQLNTMTNGKMKEDMLKNAEDQKEKEILNLQLQIGAYKEQVHLFSNFPDIFSKKNADRTPEDIKIIEDFYREDKEQVDKAIFLDVMDELEYRNYGYNDEIEILRIILEVVLRYFNDETYTNKGVINFASRKVEEIYSYELSKFTSKQTNFNLGEFSTVKRNTISNDLVEKITDILVKAHEEISELEEEYDFDYL